MSKYAIMKINALNELFNMQVPRCAVCEKVVSLNNLDLHHIESTSKAMNPSRAARKNLHTYYAELSKCIPLCKCCHKAYHSAYGKKATTETFVEFMTYSK